MDPNDDSSSDDEGINEILRINSGDLVNGDNKKRSVAHNNGSSNSPIKRVRREDTHSSTSNFIWNEKMDELLSQFANDNPNDWVKISDILRVQLSVDQNSAVGLNPDPIECAERWTILNAEVFVPWTDEEVATFESLVAEQQANLKSKEDRIRWSQIAKQLNRSQQDIFKKWHAIKGQTMKHGSFTPEEDAFIAETVLNWKKTNQKTGIWVHLEKVMNRRDKRISERWRHHLSKQYEEQTGGYSGGDQLLDTHEVAEEGDRLVAVPNHKLVTSSGKKVAKNPVSDQEILKWTEEMDMELREAVALYGKDWSKVASFCNVPVSSKCRKRWVRLQDKQRKSFEQSGNNSSAIQDE